MHRSKPLARIAALLALVLLFVPPALASETLVRQTFLLIADTDQAGPDGEGRGGMARIAAVIRAERAADPSMLVLHAGDAISPSLLSSLDRGAHMIELLGRIGVDIFVPGNHEYDFGPQVFRQRMAEATFPVLAANLADAEGRPLDGIGAARMLEKDGIRIGILGLTADHAPVSSSPGDLRIENTLAAATRLTAALRADGADIVVILTHATRATDEALRRESGADLVLSGDDHDLVVAYDGRTAFAEPMQNGHYVVVVELDIALGEQAGRRTVAWRPGFRVIDTGAVEPDPEVAARVAELEAALAPELDQEVGRALGELDSRTVAVRGGEAAIGNLFADALREALGADAAILNGGGIRGNRVYPPGTPILRRDVLTELPFSNLALLLEVSGAELRQALEQGLAGAERLSGAFPQVSGLRVRADLSRPAGERIVSIEVGGRPIDDHARYRLATNDYLARGGNGYEALRSAKRLTGAEAATPLTDRVIDHIVARGSVEPRIEGRLVVARERPPE